jgi:hypothetical protein
MHCDEESARTAVTLFAGHLDFKARDADIWESFQSKEFFLLIVGYK